MGVAVLIGIIILFEIIQILLSNRKIGKWIQPAIVFLMSIHLMISWIIFESANYMNAGKTFFEIFEFDIVKGFAILNIPTIMFILTNIIVKRINKSKNMNQNNPNKKKIILSVTYIIALLIIGIMLASVFYVKGKEEEIQKSQLGGTLTENEYLPVPDRIIYKNGENEYCIMYPDGDSDAFDTIFTEISNRVDSIKDGEVLDDEKINSIKENGKFVELDYNTKSKNKIFPLDEENITMINMFEEGGQVKKTTLDDKEKLIKKLESITKKLKKYQFEKNNIYISDTKLIDIPSELDFTEKSEGIYQLAIENEKSYKNAISVTNFNINGNTPTVDFSEENVVMTISRYEIGSIEENIGNIKYKFSSIADAYRVSVLVVSRVVNVNCIYCEVKYEATSDTENKTAYTTARGIIQSISDEYIEVGLTDTYLTHKIKINHITYIKDFVDKKKINIKDLKIGDCIYIEGNKVTSDNDLEKIEANTIYICDKETVKKEVEKYIKDTYRIDGWGIQHYNIDGNGNGYIIIAAYYEDFIYPIKLKVNSDTETYLGMGLHLESNYGYVLYEMSDITLDTKITDIDNVEGHVKMIEYIAD